MLDYDVLDRPRLKDTILCALQHFLSVISATIIVPTVLKLPMQIPAAILGAGLGTLMYIFITKKRSPIFLSSNFSFIPSMGIAVIFGYLGIIIGVILASLIYIIASIIIHFVGTKWLDKLIPAAVIGPIVVLIGLSLASDCTTKLVLSDIAPNSEGTNFVALAIALITFFVIVFCASQNKKKGIKLIPFIIGIGVGYVLALISTLIGRVTNVEYLQIFNIDRFTSFFVDDHGFKGFTAFLDYPRVTLIEAIKELINGDVGAAIRAAAGDQAQFITPIGVLQIALAFIPVAFVGFAEHIADHKNLSYVIGHNLLEEPGLSRTLMGDGVGSIVGTLFGCCPNTTYGESIACIAQSRNASTIPVILSASFCVLTSFVTPLNAIFACIPMCIMSGACIALYGYIALSGLNVMQTINLKDEKNMFTAFAILITGVGGMVIKIPLGGEKPIELTAFACALTLGILTYHFSHFIQRKTTQKEEMEQIDKTSIINRDDKE